MSQKRRPPLMLLTGVGLLIAAAALGYFLVKEKKETGEAKPVKIAAAPVAPTPQTVPPIIPPPAPTETIVEPTVQHAKSHDDLKVSTIELQKTPGTSLVHAVGVVKNDSDFVRYGVKIELLLLNKDGKKLGTGQDYQATIEPHQDWRFKALVPDAKTVQAKLLSLSEDE